MSKALVQVLARRDKVDAEIGRILKRDYPPGAGVSWKRNGIHSGVVLAHNGGDRIKVKNERTNRELWIYAYCIAELVC